MISPATEKYLWDSKFPEECKLLPYDYLEFTEQELVDKCIAKEELSEDEKAMLKLLLNRYRKHFKEYNLSKAEESVEQANKIINTQSQLLEIIHDKSRYRIDMYYWLNGERYLLQMRIKPYTEKQYIEGASTQMGLFKDLDINEKKVMAKAEMGQTLSPEEVQMIKALNDKLNEKLGTAEYNLQVLNEFLADRIEFIGDEETTFEENLLFWKQVDLNTKASLFHEVRGRLKLTDTFQEDLFPAVR
ncbi:MAG: hypothetical protein Q4P18_07245 [Methanobrevibacter sp.]|uniref:hypothetical protein n=1 Tax=Methanobrevibacter sp. TaxID=66852 RepID=UPI0026DEDBAF|nr:hypothetical protein [Methanobrevibacter sp.]MDO5849313.1 hypothetical protein [Methanobrevibacter sp.]